MEDTDSTMRSLAADEYSELLKKLTGLAETTFPQLLIPPSETSHLSAMIELKAGVGGSEAMLFAADVLRMYMRLAPTLGWKATIVANNVMENGGVKDAIVEVQGKNAYDTLRWESGVHRVQRVPATESSGRVHTSTVAVLVRRCVVFTVISSKRDPRCFHYRRIAVRRKLRANSSPWTK